MTRKLFAIALISDFSLAAAYIAPPKVDARASAATNGSIAFSSSRPPGDTSAPQVYTVDPDGSNLSPALTTGLSNGDPAWSPDGTQIAFGTFEFAGSPCCNSIAIMNADGTNHHKAVNGTDVGSGYIGGPAWSPDGTKLAFHVGPDGDSHIWTSNADGSNLTQLTFGAQSDYFPAWSPDGTRIAFESNRQGGYDIYSMKADGSDVQQLTSMDGPEELPAWSPDGSRIAFDNHPITGGYQLWLMDADGSNQTKIFGNSSENDTSAAWSPDGTKIAFVSDRDNDSHRKIWTINADGSNPTRVTNPSGGSDDYPSWGGAGGGGGGGGDDASPPAVSISLRNAEGGSGPDGFDGWFRFPFTVTVTADDTATGGSKVAAIDCGSFSLATSGIGTTRATGTHDISAGGESDISCTASDAAGNTSDPVTQHVKLDRSAPSVFFDITQNDCNGSPVGPGGWCHSAIGSPGFVAQDDLSGVSTPFASPCPAGQACVFHGAPMVGIGTLTEYQGEVCDVAGNCIDDDRVPGVVELDTIAPVLSRDARADSCSQPGNSGWCRGTQTVGFKLTDSLSGSSSPCTAAAHLSCQFTANSSDQGAAVSIPSGQACDIAGNCIQGLIAGPFKIDSVAPTVTRNQSLDSCSVAGNLGWCRGTQTAGFTDTDATSGVGPPHSCDPGASCDVTKSTTVQGAAVTIPLQACDAAGNCNTSVSAGPFKIDSAGPQISVASSSCSLPGTNGWCRGTEKADFSFTDSLSGPFSPCKEQTTCDVQKSTTTQGAAVTIDSGQACDQAGNCSQSVGAGPFKIDRDGPQFGSVSISPQPVLLHAQETFGITWSDSVSGVASQTCDASMDTSTAGIHHIHCQATDAAGNTSFETVSYTVQYKILGFFSPPQGANIKRGTTVLVKFALADVNGNRISDAEAASVVSQCILVFRARGAQTHDACVGYNSALDEFRYSWHLAQQVGAETIKAHMTVGDYALSEQLTIVT